MVRRTGRFNSLQIPQVPCNGSCRCRRGPVVHQQETHTEVPTSTKTYQCSQRQPSLKVATVFLRTPDHVQRLTTMSCNTLKPMESMLATLHSLPYIRFPQPWTLLSPLLPRESGSPESPNKTIPFSATPAGTPCPACCTHFCSPGGFW